MGWLLGLEKIGAEWLIWVGAIVVILWPELNVGGNIKGIKGEEYKTYIACFTI